MAWIVGAFILYYLFIGCMVLIGIARLRAPRDLEPRELPLVSVMVAARNEEANIRACLESLLHQDYPAQRYEVIAINDRSTDGTGAILDELADQYPNLVSLHLDHHPLPGLTGKQRALGFAYDLCQGEFILNTDADCLIPPSWISQIISHFHEDTGLVIGVPVCHAVGQPASWLTKLQSLDLLHLLGYAASAASWQRTATCIGNNMAYRRRAADEIGGLVGLRDSVTEDCVLAQAIEFRTDWRIDVALQPAAIIFTEAAKSLKDFYRQRKRWLVGGIGTRTMGVFLLQLLFGFHLFLVLVPLLALLWSPAWWGLGAAALGIKFIVDSAVCYTMCRRLARMDLLRWLVPYEAFLIGYGVVVGLGALFARRIVWKGQQYAGK